MKKISYAVNRAAGSPRKARSHNAKVPMLDITSLCDILTILLVFLIKNVSMEVQKSSEPDGMVLPTSVRTESELQEKAQTIVVKIFNDKVLYGVQNRIVGTPDDLISNDQTKISLVNELRKDYKSIEATTPNANPAILLQADRAVPCQYITAFLALASNNAGYSNIFFSTVKASDLEQVFRQ